MPSEKEKARVGIGEGNTNDLINTTTRPKVEREIERITIEKDVQIHQTF
jgi:hypothetical protein